MMSSRYRKGMTVVRQLDGKRRRGVTGVSLHESVGKHCRDWLATGQAAISDRSQVGTCIVLRYLGGERIVVFTDYGTVAE